MSTKAQIQPMNVALVQFTGPDGKPVQMYITREWHRVLEQLVAKVNEQAARLDAAGL